MFSFAKTLSDRESIFLVVSSHASVQDIRICEGGLGLAQTSHRCPCGLTCDLVPTSGAFANLVSP